MISSAWIIPLPSGFNANSKFMAVYLIYLFCWLQTKVSLFNYVAWLEIEMNGASKSKIINLSETKYNSNFKLEVCVCILNLRLFGGDMHICAAIQLQC